MRVTIPIPLKALLLAAPFVASAPLVCGAQSIDTVSKSVVFLQHDYIETYSDQRGTFEVWLKRPGTNFLGPKLSTKAGTGFLICRGDREGEA